MERTRAAWPLALAALGVAAMPAAASDVKVLTAGAFRPVLMALLPAFEAAHQSHVIVANDTVGALARRISAGEAFDVAILTPEALDHLAAAGVVAARSETKLARVGIGVAVPRGAPRPPIGDIAAFRATLLAARRVAYLDPAAGGSSGLYLSSMFDRLGIGPAIRAKALLVKGGLVAAHVADGEADLGLHQISEILAVPGITLIGPIPAELQNYTIYEAALSASVGSPEASALLSDLAGPTARAVLMEKGMEPVLP